jgi:hypothetical protein
MASTSRTAGHPSDIPRAPAVTTARVHRRPSGEPPPLPRRLNASGKWWLGPAIGVVALVALLVTVRNAGLVAAEYDNRIVARLAEHRSGWLTDVMRPLGYLATGPALLFISQGEGKATTPLPIEEAVQYIGSRWLGQTTGPILEALVGRHR